MLLSGSKRVLEAQGRHEEAKKIVSLFGTVRPGEKVPSGLQQFERDLLTTKNYQRETGRTMHVEYALILAFKKLGIEITEKDMMTLGKNFIPSNR